MAHSNYDESHDYFTSPYLAGGTNPHFYEPSSVGLGPMTPQIERIAQPKPTIEADATDRDVVVPGQRRTEGVSIDKGMSALANDAADVGMTAVNVMGMGMPGMIKGYSDAQDKLRSEPHAIPESIRDAGGAVLGVLVGAKAANKVSGATKGGSRTDIFKEMKSSQPSTSYTMERVPGKYAPKTKAADPANPRHFETNLKSGTPDHINNIRVNNENYGIGRYPISKPKIPVEAGVGKFGTNTVSPSSLIGKRVEPNVGYPPKGSSPKSVGRQTPQSNLRFKE